MRRALKANDGRVYVRTVQDVEPIKKSINQLKETHRESEIMGVHVGRIPKVVIIEYMNRIGVTYKQFLEDDVHVRRILLDSEFKDLRIWEGRF